MEVGRVGQLPQTVGEGGTQVGQGELVRQALKTLGQLRLRIHGGGGGWGRLGGLNDHSEDWLEVLLVRSVCHAAQL